MRIPNQSISAKRVVMSIAQAQRINQIEDVLSISEFTTSSFKRCKSQIIPQRMHPCPFGGPDCEEEIPPGILY